MSIIDIAAGFVAYSILLCMFLFVCYVWGYIIYSGYMLIIDKLVPLVFGKDDPDDRWD